MWVLPMFEGDKNVSLMDVQHSEYGNALHCLLKTSARHFATYYMHALTRPDYVTKLVDIKSFDHRTLQEAHDKIAASFRFHFCTKDEIDSYPADFDFKQYYLQSWRIYYNLEAENFSIIDDIAIAIMECVAYENTLKGYKAEGVLNKFLGNRYPFLYDRFRS